MTLAYDLLEEWQWTAVLLAARMQKVPPANLFPAPHIYTLSGRFDTAPRNDQLKRGRCAASIVGDDTNIPEDITHGISAARSFWF